ncbi:hypothetical protein ABB37_09657 [Leptomonas pyrrhocoris]|uniref:RRM domain-containing protein n=1 Tax=Leptomonas pyrrhocoris TaxID=157538 RepID=A0A0M9FQC0_LEPPY|nr:hypothetical protein ABB37_09654 [Leptomonas pyrrhocoris]XP_015652199.1 hypothetical protein ABB37_09654 [Leptomonas pyrrhocoris]XP_015652202.1 hypothetical protein ABB37_09657 [Leptomonas pyrrhocoris]KPA73759.1 hypothetical protein ABB37_09654 [Leptomonas pyrrhocoris]KPA73760.1 hypothetical protein ABB37_09654 [Leptomonas pyrrhocoris]KPA73763.1 hypothetical protein ABB37_09657 [Leptomonas pyrrhocoris]|eukprot:XP_015652198.1 hypothetical protein ABB37_09654 [Leptomonas pyrrhocoris]
MSSSCAAASATEEEERCRRTLLIKGIPPRIALSDVYYILFGEPASLPLEDLGSSGSSGSRSALSEAALRLPIRPSRRDLRRVRLVHPPRRFRYRCAFVEFATEAAAVEAEERLEGKEVEEWGGQALQVDWADNPIHDSHWSDFDPPTGRPCLFALRPWEQRLLNEEHGFSPAAASAAPPVDFVGTTGIVWELP